MAQKVQIEIEVLNNQAKAEFDATAKGVAEISDKAAESATKVKKSFEEVGKAQRAAFASDQTKKALNENTQAVDKLATELEMLYKEEVRLLQLNKQSTEQYKQNRAEAERVRGEFDKINKTQSNYGKTVVKTSQDVSKLEDQLRKLALEGKQGTKEFEDIAKAIGEYKAAITTADRAVDLYAKTTDAATGRLGELEDKLYDLAIAGKQGTQEFKDTVQEVATLKRAVFEVDQQVDSYVERSRGLTSVVQNVELLGNAFQITEGASALFGNESEELQETLVRLNAIMVVTQGLERARQILLEQSAKKTGVFALAQKALAFATDGATKSAKAFRAVFIATGVGALVTAIGLIVGYWDDIKELIGGASREANDFLKNQEKITQEAKDQLDLLENQENQLKLQGKSEQEILKLKIAQTDEIINQLKLQKEGTKEITDEQIKNTSRIAAFFTALGASPASGSFLGQLLGFDSKGLAQISKNGQEQVDEIDKQINDILEKRAGYLLDLERSNDEQLKNEKQTTQKISDEFIERSKIILEIKKDENEKLLTFADFLVDTDNTTNEELLNQRVTFLKKLEAIGEGGLQNRIAIIRAEADAQIAAIRETLGFTKDAQNQIDIINAEAQEKIRKEAEESNRDLIDKVFALVRAYQAAFDAIGDLQRQQAERRIAQIERINQVELESIENSKSSEAQKQREREALEVRTSRKILEERRKIARFDKAQGIFSAVINTAESILKTGANLGYPQAIPFQIAAGLVGAAQIAKISSEPLPQFGTGGLADRKEGLLRGKSHSEGGIPIEVEGGEFIVNKRRTKHHMKELVAMNTSRTAYDKLIQDMYVRPKLEQFALEFRNSNQAVNVNASLNSAQMETELKALRRETKRTGKVITTALGKSASSRYNWN